MVKKLQPKLRFRGFTDAWEQRRLGSLFVQANERNANQELSFGTTISVASMRFNPRGNGAAHSSLSSYKILRRGDIAFEGNRHRSHPFGQLVINDIGDGLMSSRFQSIRPKEPCVISFWKYLLQNERGMRRLLICSTKAGTLMNEFVFGDFSRLDVQLPERDEQEKIGALFRLLDSIIAAEKRKLDLLKKKKTTLLLQVFDQKLRFKRYNTPWKQRHLGVLLEETNEVASDREILSVTVSNGIYPARDGAKDSNPGESIYKYKVVHINDIVYNSMRLWQGAIGISGYEGIVSPAYTVCHVREVVDARFCAYLLRSYPALREFYRYSQGNSKDTLILKYPEFSQIIVTIPPSFSEQEDIANTLDCLNQLIAVETRKIDMLRLKKKALLQQMFI